jgi:alanyl-tRNA synthetase
MTEERLYYTDAYLVEFDAVVREVTRKDDRWQLVLDRTAFYPTSGGQPFDTGRLDEARVIDVFDDENGNVTHVVDRELEKNCRVRGHIDWDRRFDHMQQHTGQHLLSAAFERETGAKTVSFHLGTTSATIDLDKEVPLEQIAKVEAAANAIVWDDREVCVRFITASEAAKLPLRKDPAREGELRIIEITDYDMSACGGTHVSRTGGIGVIAIAGVERFKGGQRVEFMCGGRALRQYRMLRDTIGGAVRLLSVLPGDLPAAIEKLQSTARAQQKSYEGLQARLAEHEADAMLKNGRKLGSLTVVTETLPGWDATGLKKIASAITARPAIVAILIGADAPVPIVIARSQDVSIDAGDILKALIERFGGKGGGRGALAQGAGLTGTARDILDAARALLPTS